MPGALWEPTAAAILPSRSGSGVVRVVIAVLFALAWVGISARRLQILPIGRPAMALVGAAAVVVAGQLAGVHGLAVEEALRAVEPNTIGLLLAMMIVAAGLGEAGFFAWVTDVAGRTIARPAALLWTVTVGAGLLSAFLVNDAVCLLATPLVMALARARGLALRPFMFALAMGANTGSALTLSGNPQNMLVAKLSGIAYADYLAAVWVPTSLALVVTAASLHFFFRRALAAAPAVTKPEPLKVDRPLMVVAASSLVGVALASLVGASLTLSALAAASVVLLAARRRADGLLQQVDWSVLLFFAGLFVLVAALQKTGLPAEWLAQIAPPASTARTVELAVTLTAVIAIGSQIVSNVPLILLLEPWIHAQPEPALAWTLTALVSTLAGNLTLLGSVANIIVVERSNERLGFRQHLRVGVPVTLATVAVAVPTLLLLW